MSEEWEDMFSQMTNGTSSSPTTPTPTSSNKSTPHHRNIDEEMIKTKKETLFMPAFTHPLFATAKCTSFKPSTLNPSSCTNCNAHKTLHNLAWSPRRSKSKKAKTKTTPVIPSILHLVSGCRNIRCLTYDVISSISSISTLLVSDNLSHHKLCKKQITNMNESLSSLSSATSLTAEKDAISTKLLSILNSLTAVFEPVSSLASPSLCDLMHVISCCDELYYYLYYISLRDRPSTTSSSTSTSTKKADFFISPSSIPPPTRYFSPFACFASPVNVNITEVKSLKYNKDEYKELERFDPLLALQFVHSLEVGIYFASWKNDKPAASKLYVKASHASHDRTQIALSLKGALKTSTNKFKFDHAVHDPPFPPGLSRFHEVSRRWPCHLYGYATIPKTGVTAILAHCKSQGCGVLEMGAGTGYLCKLLRSRSAGSVGVGVDVVATDLKANGDNEYHGDVPPWTAVVKCSSKNVRKACKDFNERALILCYPPPDCEMALEAVKGWKGEVLVHVGEFCGVTATVGFEEELTANFKCIETIPCLPWGTDSSTLTVWKRLPLNTNKKIFLPSALPICRICNLKSSEYRSKLVRTLEYCGVGCFVKDGENRRKILEESMVFGMEDGKLEDERLFLCLKSVERCRFEGRMEEEGRKNKKRRTNE